VPGKFVISLDFELMWGVRDCHTIKSYGENVLGARVVIPQILELFEKYGIGATWATVGFLFLQDKNTLISSFPAQKPGYLDKKYNPYLIVEDIGDDETEDPYYFANSLVRLIMSYPEQEISTHTFSHYYCLEEGQTVQEFDCDLKMAVKTALKSDVEAKTIVFPRNQYDEKYLEVCKENGLIGYRGNPESLIYRPANQGKEYLFKRILRLLDAYLNLTGHHTHKLSYKELPVNIPASRFFRPFSNRLSFLERLKINRIKKGMLYAAQNNECFHLWWHPHNFGKNIPENLAQLAEILEYYSQLEKQYSMKNYTMRTLAEEVIHGKK
jgi:peptidoglycan/xylan/chitin deacetylase (PgdA/CDA1 family)